MSESKKIRRLDTLFFVCYCLSWVGLIISVCIPIGPSFILGGWTYYAFGLLISVTSLIFMLWFRWQCNE